ncbi:MAG: diguanylate cyclase protein [Mycobacterium sp.]|nr:diguanylate cyclase protein [Mycobacterium sp.]
MPRSLEEVVTKVASELMAANVDTAIAISEHVLTDLADYLVLDTCFLRHNDHELHATKLIAEGPVRAYVPDPDPIGVVYFADADPVFAMAEHLKAPLVIRPEPATDGYQRRIEEGTTVPSISLACVPLLSGDVTTGVLGFVKFGDREWTVDELNALQMIATLFAQLQARIFAENRLKYLAEHDDLTGLYSRRALIAHLERRLAAGQPGPVAALFLDLDRLKAINDFLGHHAGDRFIAFFAGRLREPVGEQDLIARLGGDEFMVIPAAPMGLAEAESYAHRVQAGLRGRVTINDEILNRTVSIGVAVGVPGRDAASDLMRQVDQALMSAKSAGGDAVAVFTEDLALKSEFRNDIELHLRGGIESGGLVLHYLPEVDLRTGAVVATEALVRWNHPTRGLLLPDSFIAVAESTNLAGELGRLVLKMACAQLRRWRLAGLAKDIVVRVNVSPVQLVAEGFVDSVARTIDEFGLDPGSVCLEITESVVVKDIEAARVTITGLKAVGVKVAVDDFGTGHSVLTHLKSLPVDTIKIDRSFVSELGNNAGDLAIARAIVALADAFELQVVAEGVETEDAARTLLSLGCVRAQGFLLSRPLDGAAMGDLLARGFIPFSLGGPDDALPVNGERPVADRS